MDLKGTGILCFNFSSLSLSLLSLVVSSNSHYFNVNHFLKNSADDKLTIFFQENRLWYSMQFAWNIKIYFLEK